MNDIPELVTINRVRQTELYNIFFRVTDDSIESLRSRLKATGVKVREFVVIAESRKLGSSFDRTVFQFKQVSYALVGDRVSGDEQPQFRLSENRLAIITRELKSLELDWISDRLESSWLMSHMILQTQEKNSALPNATDFLFRSLSSLYESFISQALVDMGEMFGNLDEANEKRFFNEYNELTLELRDFVEMRRAYVNAADEQGLRNSYVRSLSANRRG